MNVNLRLETSKFCYVYNEYKIINKDSKQYIIPEENATRKVINITEYIDNVLVDTLNIGKKVFLKETIEDFELLDFCSKYGLFGFMIDLPINKYFILDKQVAIRDSFYINYKENVNLMNLEEYLKAFLPKLSKLTINNLIKKCEKELKSNMKEEYITSIINDYLIYSKDYAEPIDMILNYARSLYKSLYSIIEHKPQNMNIPFLSANNLTHNFDDLYYNNSFGFTINYLKQAIDVYYSMQIGQDVRLLKICNFCNKAFIANNPKAEYDTPQCKNKANVYKSRGKDISRNATHTEDGRIIVKVTPSKELSDSLIKMKK